MIRKCSKQPIIAHIEFFYDSFEYVCLFIHRKVVMTIGNVSE